MGIYQIIFLDKIPKSAAVNESVNLAKRYGHTSSSNFVNAILRKVEKQDYEELFQIKNDVERISKTTSMPEWIVKKLIEYNGLEKTKEICENSNLHPKVTIRINKLKNTKQELENSLKEKNIEFEEYDGVNSFATLLRAINKIEGIERIRFVSPHPKDFTDDVIEAIADCEKVCKLIHLPLQSGSSKVLKTMNRKYTKEQYLALVEKMKAKIPNLTLSTDIIVGFAGETEEDFEDTLDVVRKVCFEQVYMFIYSRRVGTPGDKMQNQVPEDIKHKRFDRLKELVESQIAKNNSKYVGTIQKVLVEGPSKNNPELLTGRTDSNKVVIFEGSKELIDTIIDLKIISEHMWYLKGKII